MVVSAARLGGLAAGGAMVALVGVVDPLLMLPFLGGACLLTAALLLPVLRRAAISTKTASSGNSDASNRLWTLMRHALQSRLVLVILLSTLLLVLLRNHLVFQYSTIFEETFGDKESLAAFIGSYKAVANALALAVQLLVVPPLIRSIGIGRANLLYALCLTSAPMGMLALPGL
ncbi:unnamed protein product, partial [marine sediment metagenome]